MVDQPSKAVAIASHVVDGGAVVEMILDPETNRTAFLRMESETISRHDDLDISGIGRVVPYSPLNNLLAHQVVLFPSEASEYQTVEQLLADVRAFIHRYADLSASFEEIASLYVLLSWVYDRYSVVPYIRLKGDYGTGKTRCLQVIGSVAYKPMFVSGASTVSPMFRIIDAFRGTLILDESDFRFSDEKAEIVKILNNGNAAGFPVLRSDPTPAKDFNPRAFSVFGPKIIATRRDFEDQALESRCITEVMAGLPPRKDIPLSLPDSFRDEARELRNKLLLYRFRERQRVPLPDTERDDALEARVAQVFAPLASIAPDIATRERVLEIAKMQTTALHAERSASLEAQLLDTLYSMRRDGAAFYVRDICARFAEKFGGDYERPITPRWIGAQLRKRLSLLTLKSHGTYLVPESEHQKVLLLFERFKVEDDRVDVGTSGTF